MSTSNTEFTLNQLLCNCSKWLKKNNNLKQSIFARPSTMSLANWGKQRVTKLLQKTYQRKMAKKYIFTLRRLTCKSYWSKQAPCGVNDTQCSLFYCFYEPGRERLHLLLTPSQQRVIKRSSQLITNDFEFRCGLSTATTCEGAQQVLAGKELRVSFSSSETQNEREFLSALSLPLAQVPGIYIYLGSGLRRKLWKSQDVNGWLMSG